MKQKLLRPIMGQARNMTSHMTMTQSHPSLLKYVDILF